MQRIAFLGTKQRFELDAHQYKERLPQPPGVYLTQDGWEMIVDVDGNIIKSTYTGEVTSSPD